jgi:phospholipid transport system substrate-binding protein
MLGLGRQFAQSLFGRGPAPVLLLVCGAAALGLPAAIRAEEPLEVVRRHVAEGLAVLRAENGPAEAAGRELKRRRLAAQLARAFDFEEFSRLALGAGWARFDPAERREFVELFARFLSEYYLGELLQRYAGETVVLLRQRAVAPQRAVVELEVLWRRRRVPVEVRMLDRGGGWKAYDVALLGVSAVMLYRAQLQAILARHSPAETIAILRRRLAEAEDGGRGG